MNSKWILIGLTLVLLTFLIQESESKSKPKKASSEEEQTTTESPEEEEEEKPKEKKAKSTWKDAKCQGKKLDYPKEFSKAIKKCGSPPEEGDDKEAKTGPVCENVCIWDEVEYFTGKSKKVDSEALDALIDKIFPEFSKAAFKKEWKDCKKEIGEADDDDKKCKRHKKYFTCISNSLTKHCSEGGQQSNKPAQKPGGLLGVLGR